MDTGFTFTVRAEEDGKTVQRVLQNRYGVSRRLLRKLKINASVTVNGAVVYLTSRVTEGDEVRMSMPNEREATILPEPIPIDIIAEDEDLIVLNKPPGIVVHPTKHYPDGTLANGLVHHWHVRGESRLVRPVNRLDKDTSGVIVFAKHAYAHDFLAKQLHTKTSLREYRTVVHGIIEHDRATVVAPIARDPEQPSRRTVHSIGARAITHYTVLQRFETTTYVSCRLETGRTHQIRVHLQTIGYPIVGDPIYRDPERKADDPITRQALHAYAVRFVHPRIRKVVTYKAELPHDIRTLIAGRTKQDVL